MKPIDKPFFLTLFIAIVSLYTGRLLAEETAQSAPKEPKPSPAESSAAEGSAEHPATQATPSASASSSAAAAPKKPDAKAQKPTRPAVFVDRDGDGISDGKEHRFRRRSPRRSESGGGYETMKQNRSRNRNGSSSGNGSRGR